MARKRHLSFITFCSEDEGSRRWASHYVPWMWNLVIGFRPGDFIIIIIIIVIIIIIIFVVNRFIPVGTSFFILNVF
jgi:hypothetical protein